MDTVEDRVRLFLEGQATAEYTRLHQRWEEEKKQWQPQPGATPEESAKRHRESQKLDRERPTVPKVGGPLVANTVKAIRARRRLPDELQLDTWLPPADGPAVVAVRNGLLDPVTRTLQPHSPDWFSTVKLPVAFDAAAPKPAKWVTLVDELMEGDADRVAVIQEVFGACLDRPLTLKWFAAFVGDGNNGKSVVLSVLKSLLGAANCSATGLHELSTNRFASFSLFGKLANLVGDQGYVDSTDEGKLKTLTGGDQVTFEQKGRDTFTAVNHAKIVFACNTMPTFGDKSEALWNRLIAIPFDFTVPPDRKDPAFLHEAYWAEELPGILNWSLEGLERLRSQGRFTHSEACEALKAENREDSNPARQFLLENYEYVGGTVCAVVADLFKEYRTWCETNGFNRPLTMPKFARQVDSAFPQVAKAETKRVGDRTAKVRAGLRKTTGDGQTPPPPAVPRTEEKTLDLFGPLSL